MEEADLASFEDMWTTAKAEYELHRLPSGGVIPVHMGDPPMMVVIDEDDDLAAEVVARMMAAGVPVIDA